MSSPLQFGSLDADTTFSGAITGFGPVTKLGSGVLTLTGASTYRAATTVQAGGLLANNTTGSATGTSAVTVAGGTLGGQGIISGKVTVGTGSGTGAILAPGKGAHKAATLTLQSTLTLKSDSTYLCRLNTRKAKVDQVVANGVTIESGAQFDFRPSGKGTLRAGQSLLVMSNTSLDPITGTFSNLPEGSTITAGNNTFQASYAGGDGNDLTLTVLP